TDEKVELKLDTEKLEKIKINTSEIHNVLQEIFAEEEAEVFKSEPIEKISPENEDNIEIESGLQSLVNIIIEKENWTRNELLNAIQNKGMMLSSAIDEINEWSEEEYGDFLVEEDNDVYIVNEDVVNLIRK
ncbi:MAG: tellurite resistance TerB C-terminal domain-containing protein, partial [Erysipelotrichaceae bacterium]|nr:tellurite resistance TerB C-terminal domain-containing protein [Erysipelotrichaceae bacterium]